LFVVFSEGIRPSLIHRMIDHADDRGPYPTDDKFVMRA